MIKDSALLFEVQSVQVSQIRRVRDTHRKTTQLLEVLPLKLRNQLRVANDQRLLKYRHQQVGEPLGGAIRGGAKRRPVIATKNIIFGQVLFNDLETQVQINIRVECDDIAGHNVKLASGLQVKPTQDLQRWTLFSSES